MWRTGEWPRWTVVGVFLVMLALHSAARAAEEPATVDPGVAALAVQGPAKVAAGVYICQVFDLSLKDCKFDIDCYVWFRWTDEALKPYETFDFCNGRIRLKERLIVETGKDRPGGNYAICHVIATMNNNWDVRRFPFDRHTITVEIEDGVSEYHRLQYAPDKRNSGFDEAVKLPGWRLDNPDATVINHKYRSNFGDLTVPDQTEATYSRYILSFHMSRTGRWFFLRHFWAVVVAITIALLALFINPLEGESRFELGVGALFAVVANQYVTNASLPDVHILTVVDKLHLLAGGSILLTLIISTVSLPMLRNELRAKKERKADEYTDHKTRSRRLDMWSVRVIAAFFIAGSVGVLAGWL